ncbi:hypothetical protein E4T38_01141 [Aureobasidium subglaciale]|nr:hypothetical protein E4T38_01141 [Aureobasidium subglaciale]KAI5230273.1 hypothetical protein E4T40_01142 [Aureobasidium subglaciale]KAI5233732.1 hypothetical protein E4T41_01140 [Aureobasidium subglaciale]KAI5266979.1 hypothetical protein E4T46_01140 [Aureobasidium subglaciale]
MLLMSCQALLGTTEDRRTGHGEGAATLLMIRGDCRSGDPFERKLLASLYASVLVEGIFNPKIQFSNAGLRRLGEQYFNLENDTCRIMHCLAAVPSYLDHRHGKLCPGTLSEVHADYEIVRQIATRSRDELRLAEECSAPQTSCSGQGPTTHAHFQRIHCLNLSAVILLNRIRFALDQKSDSDLCKSADEIAREILLQARDASRYAPLGSLYLIACLSMAWLGAQEEELRSDIVTTMRSYWPEKMSRIEAVLVARERHLLKSCMLGLT